MRFAVLGSMEVRDAGRSVDITAHKQRVLLATLVSRANRPVPTDVLVETLWSGRPPASVRKALGWHLLRLRAALGDPDRIAHHADGYLLRVASDDVDAETFRRLSREGTDVADDDPATASRRFDAALALWRGRAYQDVAEAGVLLDAARQLEELRLTTLERHLDCGIRLGRHADIIAELTALVAENPHRQRFRGQLMLALYRCGRQADALETYQQVRNAPGSGPDPALRRLEQQILAEDPRLDPPETTAVVTAPPTPTPRQLPADLATFTGREAEVDSLLRRTRSCAGRSPGTIVVSALDGMAGIGKTTLAVHVAHRLAPRYPDGQLFIDLHGYSGDIAPVEPADALERMLRALGVAAPDIPDHVDDRAARFRSVLTGKRLLLVLDNAASEAQVRPLLPGGGDNLILVTSRRGLSGIEDAVTLSLDLLDPPDARRLFERAARIVEPTSLQRVLIDDIVAMCGGLPLAVRLAANRVGRTASWSLRELRDRLRQHNHALAMLSAGERSVAAAFRLSYQDLDAAHRRTFRLLSLYPGAEFDRHAAAALAGVEADRVRDQLDELCDAHLLQSPRLGRYRWHDLVRQYAADELAVAADDTSRPVTRLLDCWRHTAYRAANLAYPGVKRYSFDPSVPLFAGPRFDDGASAIDWYDTEVTALHAAVKLAVDRGLDDHAWQLAHSVDAFNHYRGNLVSGLAMNRVALVAARRLADPDALGYALNNIITCQVMLSQFPAAIETCGEALELRRATGDRQGMAAVHNNLGLAHKLLGAFGDAATAFAAAAEHARAAGNTRFEAIAIVNDASVRDLLEQWSQALELLDRARRICARPELERQLARVDYFSGVVYLSLGEPERALEYLHRCRAFAERVGSPLVLCEVLNTIAVCLRGLGRYADALRHHRLATEISDDNDDTTAHARNLIDFGRTLLETGQVDTAIDTLRQARTLTTSVGCGYEAARVAHALADASRAGGDDAEARRFLDTAIEGFTAMGLPIAARLREASPRREPIGDPRG